MNIFNKEYSILSTHLIADGQIEGQEFRENVRKLQRMSLIGHCTRHTFVFW